MIAVTAPLIPITSLGKTPDLSVFGDAIKEAVRLAHLRARGQLPPEPPEPKAPSAPSDRPPSARDVVIGNVDRCAEELSEDGNLAFSLRSLFYVIRPIVADAGAGVLLWGNFCSVITDYEAEYGDMPNMIRDARGSYRDLNGEFALGTTEVRNYQRPAWQFHKVLFVEKEDVCRVLEQAGWPQHHDCALMSSKGFASRACRDLIDKLADTAGEEPITVFCLHDADCSGSMIAQSLQEATRARGRRRIAIVDLGLQPWQAVEMGLPHETVRYQRRQPVSDLVRAHPGNWDDWLQHHRIELNAMAPRALLTFLDAQVERHGAPKVVPPANVTLATLRHEIAATVRRQEHDRVLREAEPRIAAATEARLASIVLPDADRLRDDLAAHVLINRHRHWTHAVADHAATLTDDGAAS